jgi:hypothetical protein
VDRNHDLFWSERGETLAEIDAVQYKIHDPQTFIGNRHSDYYSVALPAAAAVHQTLGLFARVAFAYAKTHDGKYLEGQKAADLFWGYRDQRTNLCGASAQG